MTNREWINSLSNKALIYLVFCSACSVCAYAGKYCGGNSEMNCFEGCMKWLEQEHESKEERNDY